MAVVIEERKGKKGIIKKAFDTIIKNVTAFGSLVFYVFFMLLALYFSIELFFKLFVSLIIMYVVAVPIRLIFFKKRPTPRKYRYLLEKIDAASFPSIHSFRIIMLAVLFSSVFSEIYIKSLLFLFALLVGFSRVYLKEHYFIDVIAGLALGLIVSLFLLMI